MTNREAKLAELLRAAMAALETIERKSVDEYGHCRIDLACADCPLNADRADGQCEWTRAQEARELLGEAGAYGLDPD